MQWLGLMHGSKSGTLLAALIPPFPQPLWLPLLWPFELFLASPSITTIRSH